MPILALNKDGQIYVTSPDREDMGGYGAMPEVVHQGDMTLGAAITRSFARLNDQILRSKRNQAVQDRADENAKRHAMAMRASQMMRHHMMGEYYGLPEVQHTMLKQALVQAKGPEYKTTLSGNAMSGNGCFGWDGMTRDQKVINAYTMGRKMEAHPVSRHEYMQAQHKAHAEKLLRLKARR